MALPNDILTDTPQKIIFRLESPLRNIYCDCDPIGWDATTLSFKRNLKLGGVFKSLNVGTLTFLGNGAMLLRDVFDQFGFNAECTLRIYELDEPTLTYIEYPTTYKAIFASFSPYTKVGDHAIGATIEFIDSSLKQKFENRKKQSVDITRLTSLSGFNIIENETMQRRLKFTAMDNFLLGSNELTRSSTPYFVQRSETNDLYVSIPTTVTQSSYTELQATNFVTSSIDVSGTENMYYLSSASRSILVWGSFEAAIDSDAYLADHCHLLLIVYNTLTNTETSRVTLADFGKKGLFDPSEFDYYIYFNQTVAVAENESIKIIIKVDEVTFGDLKTEFTITGFIANFKTYLSSIAETEVECFPVFDAFKRVLQLILDTQDPLVSPLFDDPPPPLERNPDRNIVITNGLAIRGVPLNSPLNTFAIDFEQIYKAFDYAYNIGMDFTIDDDGFEKILIDEYDKFFVNELGLDFSDRVDPLSIESEAMPELAYAKIKYGFDKFTYEIQNGNSEYNNQHERSTILNLDNELDLISPFRGDMTGMIKLLKSPSNETTEDVEGQDDTFMIKVIDSGDYWTAEKNEYITVNENSSNYGNDSLNLFITPTRSLLRHGNKIRSALTMFPVSKLRFQHSSKSTSISTIKGSVVLNERDDIVVNTLAAPLFYPIAYFADIVLYPSDIQYINTGDNRYKYYKFAEGIEGYIVEITKSNKENKATVKLVKKY